MHRHVAPAKLRFDLGHDYQVLFDELAHRCAECLAHAAVLK